MNEEIKPTIRAELKWLIFILIFAGGILCTYFNTMNKINLNTYKIEKIEEARKEAWIKYEKNCEKSMEMFEIFGKDLVSIKIKLGIED